MSDLNKVDHWECALLCRPAESFLPLPACPAKAKTPPAPYKFVRLPEMGKYRFTADPFGIWHEEKLYVFVEAYDYRNRKGRIDLFVYDRHFDLIEEIHPVLRENWHLSYPYVFSYQGAFYMLPEAWKSGKLTLYRAENFPKNWVPVPEFKFPEIGAIDATLFEYEKKWWMFWTHPEPRGRRLFDLHLSVADDLFGSWRDLGLVHQDEDGCRAGGRPLFKDGRLFLPCQLAKGTYGSGLYFLGVKNLASEKPEFIRHPDLILPKEITAPYPYGFHTLSKAGEVTLIDYKTYYNGLGALITRLLSKLNPFHEKF